MAVPFDFGFLWLAFISLFAIINPFSTTFVFLGLTSHENQKKKDFLAKRAPFYSTMILLFFVFTGALIFNLFNITIEAFRFAGGLIIITIGFAMMKPEMKENFDEHKAELKKKDDISIVPLSIPMLSGPGAIATTLVLSGQAITLPNKIGLIFVIIIINLIAYFFLKNAKIFNKVLGKAGIAVTERLMGLIVLVMGIQFIINALKIIVPQLLG